MSANDTQRPKRRSWRNDTDDAAETTNIPLLDEVVAEHPSIAPDPVTSTQAGARRARLRDDDLTTRSGHYILTYGLPRAGKTAFQSFLTYYLTHVGPFTTTPLLTPEDSAQGWEPQAVINSWIRAWRNGRFPARTSSAEDDIRELRFRMTPKDGVRTPLEFGFLEVGGELMRKVVVDETGNPELAETLRAYLTNPLIDLLLMLVVDPEAGLDNDLLFDNLLTHLAVNAPGLEQRAALGVLISKPRLALQQLKAADAGFSHYPALRGELSEEYLARFAPRTYRAIEDWPNPQRTGIMALDLGYCAALDSANGTADSAADAPVVLRQDHADIAAITRWIYRLFTGQRIGPTRLQRLLQWLKR